MKKILHTYPRIKMEETECSETSVYKIRCWGIIQKKAHKIQNLAKL